VVKLLCIVFVPLTFSCNYSKHLTKGETLLKENQIELNTEQSIKYKGEMIAAMNSLVEPKPNSHFFDLGLMPKVKLMKYNARYKYFSNNPNDEKIVNNKVQAPSLISEEKIRLSDSNLKRFMVNQGYFYAQVSDTIIEKSKKQAVVKYIVDAGKVYHIRKIEYDVENEEVKRLISNEEKRLLNVGDVFTNTKFGLERERLYKLLKGRGYYAIKTENLWCELDTINRKEFTKAFEDPFGIDVESITDSSKNISNDSLDLYIKVTPTRDPNYLRAFSIGDVTVAFKSFSSDVVDDKYQKTMADNIVFRYKELPVNRTVILQNIFFRPGELYSAANEQATYNRLSRLGTFQYVNVRYERSLEDSTVLHTYIDLTSAPRQDIEYVTDMSTSEEYFIGFGAGITYRTRNLLKGANTLTSSLSYSLEARRNKEEPEFLKSFFLNANNLSFKTNIAFPKFLLPFAVKSYRTNMPYTILGLSYNRVNRVGNFLLTNATGSFSYNWKETPQKSWLVTPAFLTYTRVPEDKLSQAFKDRIDSSLYLTNTYSDNFIMGENITYEYKSSLDQSSPHLHTIKLGVDEAGLLMQGINAVYNSISGKTISPIAHYLRLDADYRYYLTRRKYQWANRVRIGAGIPTFGDLSLPYIKQYSQGGAFSNRGWQLRNLGPGRRSPDTSTNRQLLDATGDFKLEMNTEMRFNMIRLFSGAFDVKGAVFVDAGNIWLYNEDESRPGGKLEAKYLWQDIAISGGVGLRLDFSFFIFRLDLGYPLKHPYIPTNSGWDFKGLKLNDGQWNVAIGYPF